ncbi:terminase small subunit [Alkalicoccobacillus porphyridii]|uniref:Terminase small subunit n=1 Tax=Alkalicoccobacillus porphyridii TaxID=2597270 RepID=A0A554A0E0_9BACI|nr:terminase small subunit [Alkalicoccobacillus porphyridii]TSB47133.1 terminase small subunit [Alkalicoccobacillus porphyridii]
MDWDKIRKEYQSSNITLKALADKHDLKLGTLKSRKSREGWSRDATPKKDATNRIRDATTEKKMQQQSQIVEPILVESEGITDKQGLFCVYYVKSFNATQSAIKAGYAPESAHVEGSRLLRNAKVADHIRKLKGDMLQGVFVDAMDVLNKYVQIAFADITDFVEFGTVEKQDYTEEGKPIFDPKGNPETHTVSFVDFKDYKTVDGTLITEVKQGRDGVAIKLADKMKALDVLAKYFELLPDSVKRKLEEEKIKAETAKLQKEEKNVGTTEIIVVDAWTDIDE